MASSPLGGAVQREGAKRLRGLLIVQESCGRIGDNAGFAFSIASTTRILPMQFADRLNNVETSAIRELFKLLGKPGIISFAGGFPDSAMFDVAGISAASQAALQQEPGAALQYGATEGYQPLREQIAAFMAGKGVRELAPEQLVVTTGSQRWTYWARP
jgi:DNA-binding transcriptional MocR family regulator